jgi:hypothetical protein
MMTEQHWLAEVQCSWCRDTSDGMVALCAVHRGGVRRVEGGEGFEGWMDGIFCLKEGLMNSETKKIRMAGLYKSESLGFVSIFFLNFLLKKGTFNVDGNWWEC